jgi:hypothetical protein
VTDDASKLAAVKLEDKFHSRIKEGGGGGWHVSAFLSVLRLGFLHILWNGTKKMHFSNSVLPPAG